jgi:hypothetical protein
MSSFGAQDLVLGYKITILLHNDEKAMLQGVGSGGGDRGGGARGVIITRTEKAIFSHFASKYTGLGCFFQLPLHSKYREN